MMSERIRIVDIDLVMDDLTTEEFLGIDAIFRRKAKENGEDYNAIGPWSQYRWVMRCQYRVDDGPFAFLHKHNEEEVR
jgi:hypothetical protein